MNVTNRNQSLVKSEIRHYFIRLTIFSLLHVDHLCDMLIQTIAQLSLKNDMNTMIGCRIPHPKTLYSCTICSLSINNNRSSAYQHFYTLFHPRFGSEVIKCQCYICHLRVADYAGMDPSEWGHCKDMFTTQTQKKH